MITEQILGERGVTAVVDVEATINFTTRYMNYKAKVITSFGDFTVNEETSG